MCEISVFAGAAAFVSGVGFAGLIQCATLSWLSRKDSDTECDTTWVAPGVINKLMGDSAGR